MELNVEPAVNDTISLHPAVLAHYERALPLFPTRPKSAIFPPIVRLKSRAGVGAPIARRALTAPDV